MGEIDHAAVDVATVVPSGRADLRAAHVADIDRAGRGLAIANVYRGEAGGNEVQVSRAEVEAARQRRHTGRTRANRHGPCRVIRPDREHPTAGRADGVGKVELIGRDRRITRAQLQQAYAHRWIRGRRGHIQRVERRAAREDDVRPGRDRK